MRATSEELTPVFTRQLLSTSVSSSFFHFLSGHIDEKQLFDMVFDINSHSLAKDYTGKEVNLSFMRYQCFPVMNINRIWQWKLLNHKTICIVEVIPLAATIFSNSKFLPCTRNTCNSAQKL